MVYNLISGDLGQPFLLPPDMRDWLPADDLAWFVIDMVAEFDPTPFMSRHRIDGRGGAAYDPMVMVAVLVYAYCVGERSSRRIERLLVRDVAFRVVGRNLCPDHATIARFRAAHEAALSGLFVEVLGVCETAGLLAAGLVAVDGTKLQACASMDANRDEAGLRKALEAEVRRVLDEAAAVDAEEDALYGEARGDELPAAFADPATRTARIREALGRLRAEREAAEAAEAAAEAARQAKGHKKRGPKPAQDRRRDPPRANMTDPQSRIMKVRGGFVQGYNAQAAVAESQVIVSAELTQDGADVAHFKPILDAAIENLEAVGAAERITGVVADAGYYSTANATIDVGFDVLIATVKHHKLPDVAPPVAADRSGEFNQWAARRAVELAGLFDQIAAGERRVGDVARQLGMNRCYVSELRQRYLRHGIDSIRPRRQSKHSGPTIPANTRHLAVRTAMNARLASPDGKKRYKRRPAIIEPVFGQIKDPRGIRRFQRRGLAACAAEWKLIAATHNLLKAFRHHQTVLAAT